MNKWIEYSIDYANQRSYLDDLFNVYPTIPNGIRDVDEEIWNEIEIAYKQQDNSSLVRHLCRLEKFPIKDSYIAFLKLDLNSVDRNPQTINRIAGTLYDMGFDKLWEKCTEPKETNTQIGPMFKQWIDKKSLGILPISSNDFLATTENAILKGGDTELNRFAKEHLGYRKDKGLDFVARYNGKYILAETKFITAIGGNQNNSFTDVITTLAAPVENAICIGIIDGIPWLKDKSRYYTEITTTFSEYNIMSSLVLREFLYQI
jgi:hypothetical protein